MCVSFDSRPLATRRDPSMPAYTPQQLKKALVAAGFQVFRTLGDHFLMVLAKK